MDVEKLIALVEKKSPIWDKSDRRHSNLKYLDKLWDAIAAELEVSKKAVKDKWKNLRDQYRSQLSKISVPRSGDSASDSSYEPSWSYYKPLHFLKDQMKPRTSSGNLNHSQLSQQTGNDTISDEEFDNVKIEVNDDDNSNISVPKSSSLELDRNFFSSAYQNHENNEHRGKRTSSDILNDPIEIDPKKIRLLECMPTVEKNNVEDDYFFKSLLPHMKQLLPREKMLCQMEIQRIVFKHVYDKKQ